MSICASLVVNANPDHPTSLCKKEAVHSLANLTCMRADVPIKVGRAARRSNEIATVTRENCAVPLVSKKELQQLLSKQSTVIRKLKLRLEASKQQELQRDKLRKLLKNMMKKTHPDRHTVLTPTAVTAVLTELLANI